MPRAASSLFRSFNKVLATSANAQTDFFGDKMGNAIDMLKIVRADDSVEVRLTLQGALTLYTAGQLKAAVAAARSPGSRVCMNMSGVDFVDSSGLGVLARLSRELAQDGGRLELANVRDQFATLLKFTGLESLFRVR